MSSALALLVLTAVLHLGSPLTTLHVCLRRRWLRLSVYESSSTPDESVTLAVLVLKACAVNLWAAQGPRAAH